MQPRENKQANHHLRSSNTDTCLCDLLPPSSFVPWRGNAPYAGTWRKAAGTQGTGPASPLPRGTLVPESRSPGLFVLACCKAAEKGVAFALEPRHWSNFLLKKQTKNNSYMLISSSLLTGIYLTFLQKIYPIFNSYAFGFYSAQLEK